jgi:hypothetical protein
LMVLILLELEVTPVLKVVDELPLWEFPILFCPDVKSIIKIFKVNYINTINLFYLITKYDKKCREQQKII